MAEVSYGEDRSLRFGVRTSVSIQTAAEELFSSQFFGFRAGMTNQIIFGIPWATEARASEVLTPKDGTRKRAANRK